MNTPTITILAPTWVSSASVNSEAHTFLAELTLLSIGEECGEEGLAVSMFLAPRKYMATGIVCAVPYQTGGEVFWHHRTHRILGVSPRSLMGLY